MLSSLAVLVLLAAPAWAGASFNGSAELQADSDVRLELAISEEEELGETTAFVVTVPRGFEAFACDGGLEWECARDGRTVTFTRRTTAVGEFISASLALDVHTPTVNGTHRFTVVQSDGSAQMTFHPGVAVVGGEEPAPEPSPSPSPSPSPAPSSTSSSSGGGTTASPSPAPSRSPAPATGSSTADDPEDGEGGGASTGSTAPRRTQGRSTGTTLEVTPGASARQEGPDVAGPDAADQPAIATPGDAGTADDDQATVVAGGGQGPGAGGGAPWQQWVGAALLLVGAVVLVVRQWGSQLAGVGATVATRARDVGGAAIGRLPGPWGG